MLTYRFNEIYDKLVRENKIEHCGYNTPFTACGCDDELWDRINSGCGDEGDILRAVERVGRCKVL